MNKKEVSEIKKQFSAANCAITRICGCYVDYEKNIKMESKEAFLSLPEEEIFKYFEIFKKTLSGGIGKNVLNLNFSLKSEEAGSPHDFLLQLRDSKLQNDDLIKNFYNTVIENYRYEENYYIILIHGMYDIPGKSSDGQEMFDASEDVYEFILCSICPVSLSKPGLGYSTENNRMEDLIREWVVNKPDKGFLFPAFNDRNTDIHSALYYTKKSDDIQEEFIENVLGASFPLSANVQKEKFKKIIEDTLDDKADSNVVKEIHSIISDMLEENKINSETLLFEKNDIRKIFEKADVPNDCMSRFDLIFEDIMGKSKVLSAENITDSKKLHIKSIDTELKIDTSALHKVSTKLVEGKKCIVIEVDDDIEVNGAIVQSFTAE